MLKITPKKIAFTLAEVIITLGIIGIVAEMTIPTLVNDFQTQVYRTSYKKAYADASVAWLRAYSNDLLVARSTGTYWNDATANEANFQAFKSSFMILKECTTDNTACWNYSGELYNNGSAPQTNLAGFIDNSGRAWVREDKDYGGILVDTNGNKNPNKFGKDRFRLAPVLDSTNNIFLPGIPTRIGIIDIDFPAKDPTYCTSGGCYYTSWLLGG